MRALLLAAGAFLVLSLAACQDPAPAPGGDSPNLSAAEDLAAMPEGQRNAVFIRAIRDAGLDCQGVETSARAGDHQGYPAWSARCAGGGEYRIVVTGDGNAVVLDAAQAAAAGNGQ